MLAEKASPSSFDDIKLDILNNVDYIVKWRQREVNQTKPSTIIKISLNGEIKILRK